MTTCLAQRADGRSRKGRAMTAIDMISHTSSWLEEQTHYHADDRIGQIMRGITLALATVSGVGLAIIFEAQFGNLFA